MKVGLFIPCYVDQFYPRAGLATLTLLERLGVEVEFPTAQTCCGQPMFNSGMAQLARPCAARFAAVFARYDHVVSPSGSCVAMVRHHYEELGIADPALAGLRPRVLELCEFLHDVLGVRAVQAEFPHKVGLHQSCHGLRELRLASGSERVIAPFSKVRSLLESVQGLQLVDLARPDECCGFGGTFAVGEEAVSCAMGRDRISDHQQAGAEVITGVDMSCLMHLEGLLRRSGNRIRVLHVAEILCGDRVP